MPIGDTAVDSGKKATERRADTVPVKEGYGTSPFQNAEHARRANASTLRNLVQLFAPDKQIGRIADTQAIDALDAFQTLLLEPRTYSGRTGATITEEYASISPVNSIQKTNTTERISSIEEKLLIALKAKGFPVPMVLKPRDGATIYLQKMPGLTLQQKVQEYFGVRGALHPEETTKAYNAVMNEILETGIAVDKTIDEILTNEDKAYLKDRKIRKLCGRFGKLEDEIEQDKDAYRVMEALDIDDSSFIETFKPLQQLLKSAERKHGKWIVSASANNVLVENDKIALTDFNHAEFAPVQASLVYFIDSYMPIRDWGFNEIASSPISEEQKLTEILPTAWHRWYGKNPNEHKEEFKDFAKGFYAARIPIAIRQMAYALRDAEESPNYFDYLHYTMEAVHYRNLAINTAHMLANGKDIPKALAFELEKRVQAFVYANIDEAKFKEAQAYMKQS
ncbi:hypothetical protein C4573_06745 [Candidatus Woesearchaeota archaeon]|nr:MAG: hypothetical protein C4573_06745 [Candidatus Woesearchaeota archaeon]